MWRPLGWQKDGKALWIFEPQGHHVEILDVDSGKRTLWKELSPPDPAGHYGNVIWGFEMTPDGKAYAYHYTRLLSNLFLVSGLR